MNRAEWRRQKKKSEKAAVYQFTKEQMEAEFQKFFDERAKEIRSEVIKEYEANMFPLVVGLSALVLHQHFGFGHVRMARYVKHLMEQIKCMGEEWFNAEDVEQTILSETGVCLRDEALYVLSRKERKEWMQRNI